MFAAARATLKRGRVASQMVTENRNQPVNEATAAREVGVHRDYVTVAKRVIRDAVPEVTNRVKEGKLTLHAASQIAQLPKPDQPAAVENEKRRWRLREHSV